MKQAGSRHPSQSGISYDVAKIRRDFPILSRPVNGKPLVYLDNAATTQKPQPVLDAISQFYAQECSSIRRSTYFLSDRATELFESSRRKVCQFIHASSPLEIIFVRGTTEGINLVAQTYGRTHLGAGDEILISAMEHHSNIVPWQMICEEKGAKLCIVPINTDGELATEQFEKLLGSRTRLVAVTHVSNALGTINPLREIIQLAHKQNVPVLVDGAQSIQHLPINVKELDCDFFTFSGHKMYGPTGIGVLYGKEKFLDAMPPYQGGGDMISSVTFEKTLYADLPHKFEAGTPNIAGGIGLGAAINYLESLGMASISAYEQELVTYAGHVLSLLDGLEIIGNAKAKAAVQSFIIAGIHSHDIGSILDRDGIAIRTGHHCAQPVMDFFKIPATARISLGLYNTRDEIDTLLIGLKKCMEVFR